MNTLIVAGQSVPSPEPTEDRPRPDRLVHGNPRRLTWDCYTSGPMSTGFWECDPGMWRIAFAANKQEFFQVIQGRVRLHDADGRFQEIGPGDAAIIPPGFTGAFEVVEAVRKYYVLVET